ncbi:MAG TPA: peroxidase family protein [Acidobacteriota bacterium]|nr:peroxidase family protein [Acidobacteriota bacterium]
MIRLTVVLLVVLSLNLVAQPSASSQPKQSASAGGSGDEFNPVSPARRINQPAGRNLRRPSPPPEASVRSIDGRFNNLNHPELGAASTPLLRLMAPAYGDGIDDMGGVGRPGPREVSNTVNDQAGSILNRLHASDYLWQWGQFLDHDIDLTDGADPPEPVDIAVPSGDPFFDPDSTGTQVIPFNRSIYDPASGTAADNPRQQLNEITAWIDASNVYGSDDARAAALRTNDGTGRLKTSAGNLLPFNLDGLPNAGGPSPSLFLAGDVRANEQVGLSAMHTLFVREHNRLADQIASENPEMDGEEIYQAARRIVGAQMQVITYREYLPALLGQDALPPYRGYDPTVDASISNIFSSAAYRWGHSALSPTLLRLDSEGREITEGHLPLRDAFFSPQRITDEGGIEPLLRGLAVQQCQSVDVFVVDDVRNFLFGPPGSGGFDLASLNIQRGRDHGLPGYNTVRAAFGLAPRQSFDQVTSDDEVRSRLESIYDDVDQMDAWVGGLAEDPLPNAHVGELIHAVLVEQFRALRDGDRFWYVRTLPLQERRRVEQTRLSDIIRRNTDIGKEIPNNVFRIRGAGTVRQR